MKRRVPCITIEISAILEETPTRIRVVRKGTGRAVWLPKNELGYVPGAVMVPEWLARKILAERSVEQ